MGKKQAIDRNIVDFLMQSNSLHELLSILEIICQNLDLSYLNPKLKHFKQFQFTFFGLMLRIKSLIEFMLFKLEPIKENHPEYGEIYFRLIELKRKINEADRLINKKKMKEGTSKIIAISKEYSFIFDSIKSLVEKTTG